MFTTMKFHKRLLLWIPVMIACMSEVSGEGIMCYKCTVAPVKNEVNVTQICSQFEENYQFQVYCPKSTMCMKRTIYHKLGNGSVVKTSVERGCALQLNVFKTYDENEKVWRDTEKIIRTAYTEGCFPGEDRGSPGGPPEYCFCQFNLCNGSQSLKELFIMSIIIPSILTIF
ncbi:uncharacterized protein [Chelonus insularis]|uniref:uncharacterized protein n=1 Tax=Chelonus insularis TaxID=460826 RepID=UPI00158B69AA|nr:uncharacterized protein LOC118064101 [Chelonus insularis]